MGVETILTMATNLHTITLWLHCYHDNQMKLVMQYLYVIINNLTVTHIHIAMTLCMHALSLIHTTTHTRD